MHSIGTTVPLLVLSLLNSRVHAKKIGRNLYTFEPVGWMDPEMVRQFRHAMVFMGKDPNGMLILSIHHIQKMIFKTWYTAFYRKPNGQTCFLQWTVYEFTGTVRPLEDTCPRGLRKWNLKRRKRLVKPKRKGKEHLQEIKRNKCVKKTNGRMAKSRGEYTRTHCIGTQKMGHLRKNELKYLKKNGDVEQNPYERGRPHMYQDKSPDRVEVKRLNPIEAKIPKRKKTRALKAVRLKELKEMKKSGHQNSDDNTELKNHHLGYFGQEGLKGRIIGDATKNQQRVVMRDHQEVLMKNGSDHGEHREELKISLHSSEDGDYHWEDSIKELQKEEIDASVII